MRSLPAPPTKTQRKSIYFTPLLLVFIAVLMPFALAACTTPLTQDSSSILNIDTPFFSILPEIDGSSLSQPPPSDSENLADSGEATRDGEQFLVIEELIIGLLFIAVIVGIAARQLRVPYTVGLVIIGLLLALRGQVEIQISPNLILALLVPPLVFEAAFHLNYTNLRQNIGPIFILAVPGVLLTMVIVGAIVSAGTGLALPLALVFGALVAATDPVSVVALFRSMGVPTRLQTLLEGESLLNDGTAIVIFNLVLLMAIQGVRGVSLAFGIIDFLFVVGGGLAVGFVLGILVSEVIRRIDDYLIETTLTTVLAFGSYLIAEHLFGVSGVLAVVAAGLVNGNIGPRGMSPTTRIVVINFWEYAAFIANTFIFLLIGLRIDLFTLFDAWQWVGWAIIAVLIARAISVYGFSRLSGNIPRKWQHVLFWGGLRGAISLALALSLPADLENVNEIQFMAFGVVLFTLLVQGFSMAPLVRRLGLVERSEIQDEYERRHARAVASRAAYEHLERRYRQGLLSDHIWKTLAPYLKENSRILAEAVQEVMSAEPSVEAEEMDTARREALRAQRSTISNLRKEGVLSEENYSQLAIEIDTALTDSRMGWPELDDRQASTHPPIDCLMAVVIQTEDLENAFSALTKLGFLITRMNTSGGFLRRRNVALLIGLSHGEEISAVTALSASCRKRVVYLSSPIEGMPASISAPIQVIVGGATIFTFEVERFEVF